MEGDAMECDANNIIVDTATLTLCRLCTEQQGKYHIGPMMQEQIKECFDIVIKTFDGLSQIICNKCQIIAGEIFQAKKNFKIKQQALLERRKQLILKESMGKDDSISSSTSVLNPSPSLQANTTVSLRVTTQTANTCSSHKENSDKTLLNLHSNTLTENIHAVNTHPTPLLLGPLRRRNLSKDSVVSADDQVPSVSSSERVPTPNAILKDLLNKNHPLFTAPDVVEVDDCAEDDKNDKVIKNDSQSVESSMFKDRYICKFHCIFCEKEYSNKTQLRRHRINCHERLMKLTCALTTPCSIQMEKINLFQRDSATSQAWVQTKPTHRVRYSGSDPFLFATQHPIPRKDAATVDLDSSDEDSSGSLAKLKNVVKTQVTNADKTDAIRVSTESAEHDSKSVAFSISDSDSRGSFDTPMENAVKQETAKEVEVRPVEIIPAPKAKTKSKFALDKAEIYRIVQSCWKTAMIKKSLTAPVSKPWLTHEIMSNHSVDVVWVNSKAVKVSRVTMTDLDKIDKDPLASLSIYNSSKRKEPVNGHLKLRKVAEVVPDTGYAAKEPVTRVTPVITETVSKEMKTRTPIFETTKENNDAIVDVRQSSPFNTNALLRLSPTDTIPRPAIATQVVGSVIKKNSDVSPNVTVMQTSSISTPILQGVGINGQVVKFPNLMPMECPKSDKPFLPLKAEKRNLNVISAANDSPAYKKYCKIVPKPIDLVDAPNEQFMSPIIVSTMSLAGVETKDNTNEDEVPVRPMIKCKPTSLLMASPGKSTIKPEQTNKVSFPTDNLLTPSHILNSNLYTAGGDDPPNSTYTLNQNLNCVLNKPDTALPLLSQNFTLFNDGNTTNHGLNSGGNIVDTVMSGESLAVPTFTPVIQGTIYNNLVQLLKCNNVDITSEPLPSMTVWELVRFILTIREKSLTTEEYSSSEFLVEVGVYNTNTLLIGIQDCLSMPVDIYKWSDEFQSELVKSLKKDNFLQTMRDVSSYASQNMKNCVQRFISAITSFECNP